MPLRVRNWADPLQRMLYALDRDLDKLVSGLQTTPLILQDKTVDNSISPEPPVLIASTQRRANVKKDIVVIKRSEPTPTSCCEKPHLIYSQCGHDWVCRNCARCTHANFEEVGDVVQFEQRANTSPIGAIYCPYDRNKHFKKVLRDVAKLPIRVPKTLLDDIRKSVTKPINVVKVRAYLRNRKLFHYYSSANYMAHALGDQSHRINIDTRAYDMMCREADAFSDAFDRMRADGVVTRKNFVNAHVLILRIAMKKFNMPQIKKYLRLPRESTRRKHEQLLDQVAEYRGLEGV